MSRKSRKGIRSKKQALRIDGRRTSLEALEPRQMLAGDPVISEFQAINSSTIQDGAGNFTDWIEIENQSPDTMNLQGWYLTDDINDLTKWEFPSVSLPGGDQILVFASGDDNVDANGSVHTNFRLSGDGEYLALVNPDGAVVQEFAPEYPAQFEDQSYGFATGRDSVTFVGDGAAVRAFVPTSDALGTTWTNVNFNDAAWTPGTLGVGYEQLASGYNLNDGFTTLGPQWTTDIPTGGTSTVSIESGRLRLTVPAGQELLGEERGLGPVVYRDIPGNPADFEIITQVETGSDRGGAGIALYDVSTGKVALQVQYSDRLYFRLFNGDGSILGSKVSVGRDSYFLRVVRDSTDNSWNAYYKINEGDDWTFIDSVIDDTEGFTAITDLRVGPSANTATNPVTANFDFFEVNVPDEAPVYGPESGLDVGTLMEGSSSIY